MEIEQNNQSLNSSNFFYLVEFVYLIATIHQPFDIVRNKRFTTLHVGHAKFKTNHWSGFPWAPFKAFTTNCVSTSIRNRRRSILMRICADSLGIWPKFEIWPSDLWYYFKYIRMYQIQRSQKSKRNLVTIGEIRCPRDEIFVEYIIIGSIRNLLAREYKLKYTTSKSYSSFFI